MKHLRLMGLAMAMALVLGLGTQTKAGPLTLSDLINRTNGSDGTLVSGDCLKFQNFSNFFNGSVPPNTLTVDPSQITVAAVTDPTSGDAGIGFFFYQPAGLAIPANGLASFTFHYDVVAQGGASITGATGEITNYTGDVTVDLKKTVKTQNQAGLLANIHAYSPLNLYDHQGFGGQPGVYVTDNIYAQGGPKGGILGQINQYYTCTTGTIVPEPSSVVLMGMGLSTLGALVIRRRRRAMA